MRLFIAIRLDNKLLGALSRYQGDLKKLGVMGHYTPRENMHITLAFIGEYNDPNAVLEAMEKVEFIPFDRKKFSPHITLIRKYDGPKGKKIAIPNRPGGNMIAREVSLMRSERGKNGMIYTEIGSVG